MERRVWPPEPLEINGLLTILKITFILVILLNFSSVVRSELK
jgi:hypothetical protein